MHKKEKKKLGSVNALYPMSTVIVGTEVKGRVNTYCDEDALTDGKIDYSKVRPIFFDMPRFKYWNLGEIYANSYSIGK